MAQPTATKVISPPLYLQKLVNLLIIDYHAMFLSSVSLDIFITHYWFALLNVRKLYIYSIYISNDRIIQFICKQLLFV